ncbi:hypothetical protein PMZ80_010297 [Knufia obscura]|uniref:SMP-30/Gluconolactonase/LRE-like region domain-containing protein n=2 Tax=Knufia TaxID=430999 RepID=A0AAN8EBW0_9EURO|nr:hypothetical protein PMZ80_010297 [Knufia obscura]KAK5951804.1 hypothetical protein OHC33_007096 [Knufia fluminis]
MTELTQTIILGGGMYFGESPRYHDGLLYISDMTGRKVYTIDTRNHNAKSVLVEVENQPNGMSFAPDGSLIYSSMFDAKLYRLKDGKSELFADLSHVMTGYCGDMVIDGQGRVYIDDTGARVLHGEKPSAGRLLMVDTDRSVKIVAENAIFPNALFIDNSGTKLYLAETFAQRLNRFDIAVDGTLSGRSEWWTPAELVPEQDGSEGIWSIDGGCMDADGSIWLSMLAYQRFIRLDPDKRITHQINVKGHATACTLGGEDGKTLFLVTNEVPEGENLFAAMVGRRTKCIITSVRVESGRGSARP